MKFSKLLVSWYLINKRDLPWRKTTNPYLIWLSEIMLQQTRINQGLSYYIRFVEAFPTVFKLAAAKEEDVLKLWQGLGYYSRARNLHFSANYIVHNLNGVFPQNYKELLKLKGVGDYTASAIASICFHEPTAVVDGNVYRVLSRYFGIETPINSAQGIKEFKKLAQELIAAENPGNHNQAVMEFGATICKPQNPTCNICVLNHSCLALKKKLISKLPVKEQKLKIKNRFFNYIVIQTDDDKTVLQKRSQGIWKNLYEFPLIETSKEIDENELIAHEKFEQLFSLQSVTVKLFNQELILHKLTHQHIYTKFWIVKTQAISADNIPWQSINKYPVSKLIDNFLCQFKNN